MGDEVEMIAAQAVWGAVESAVECSHRPEHIRTLFCDANASHRFARAMLDALASHGWAVVRSDVPSGSEMGLES